MRVLFIGDVGSVGGAARALIELTCELRKLGIEPIVCTSVSDELNSELDSLRIENFACGHQAVMNTKSPYKWKRPLKYPYEFLRYYRTLPKALNSLKRNVDLRTIDIIHTNSARNDIGCLLNKEYGIPHVMHIREFGQEDFDCCIYRPNYYEYLNHYCTRILAISKAVQVSWIIKGIEKDKISVLYDGVDISSIEMKNPETFSAEKLRLIIAGGVCATKGQHIAVKALSLLPDEVKCNVSLDIAGWFDDAYADRLKCQIYESGLSRQVSFLGSRKDLYSILKEYDVGLMCSKSEGFGRATAEYLYAGLGVIAANTGASPELVLNEKTGLIYDRESPESLAKAISKFYYNKELLRKYATTAHIDAARFSSERNAREVLDVYKKILGQ